MNILIIKYNDKQLNISKSEKKYLFNNSPLLCDRNDMVEFIFDYLDITNWKGFNGTNPNSPINLQLNEFNYDIRTNNGVHLRKDVRVTIERYIRLLDESSKPENRLKYIEKTTKLPKPKLFQILYDVYGVDHDGYCSGEEACEEEYNRWIDTEYVLSYRDLDRIKDTSEFNHENEGCTSGGSGYCIGFKQMHTVNKISLIEGKKFHIEGVVIEPSM